MECASARSAVTLDGKISDYVDLYKEWLRHVFYHPNCARCVVPGVSIRSSGCGMGIQGYEIITSRV